MARLAGRGMPEADARSRMAAQASDEQRRAVADEVIENDGDLAALSAAVDRVWARISAGRATSSGRRFEGLPSQRVESSFGTRAARIGPMVMRT